MRSKIRFLILYFLVWVVFFELLRLIFLFYHLADTRQLSFTEMAGTCIHGLRMDMSMAGYISLPVFFFTLLGLVFSFFARPIIYKIYTYIILFFVAVLSLCDLEIYSAWGFRIDATPLQFLSSPREALASISYLPLVWISIGFIVCFVLLLSTWGYILRKIFFLPQPTHRIVTGLLVMALMAVLLVPIRGGFQLAPLNQSSVYFSTKAYANHAAVNASWNFLHSLFSKNALGKNPYQYVSTERQQVVVDSLYRGSGVTEQWVRFPADTPTNVIVIVWESFTAKVLDISIDNVEVTPRFNQLKQQGIYFSNIYASGDRTNKGLPAILSGYPAMPNTTIIHSPSKSARLKVLPQVFKQKGYVTPFFYGGEPEFANIKSYVLTGGFDRIISKNDFTVKDMNSKWGAHDGVVMKRVMDELNKSARPFFTTWLTLSSHEPFETPVPVAIKGNDVGHKFPNSLHYTDQVIGEFIDQCSRQPWWNNTVIIITGDHGHRLPIVAKQADDFRIPLLWLGGALIKKGVVIDKIYSQVDIATTLIRQAGIMDNYFPFSKNMADPAVIPWAFFCFNNGFGFVDNAGRLVFDNVGKRPVQQEGNTGEKETEAGKVMQQFTYDDFLKK